MSLTASTEYRQYRVPRSDGSSLVDPNRTALLHELSFPSCHSNSSGLEFCGQALESARRQARQEVVQRALQYTRSYSDPTLPAIDPEQLPALIMSGHQPELFHPGVWFKNFLLSSLAGEGGAIGINFLVDNDLCRSTSIRVPALDPVQRNDADGPNAISQSVLYDAPRDAIPWELRRLGSRQVWRDFPRAVEQALLPGVEPPLLLEAWPDAIDAVAQTDRPGLALATMRHRLEQRLGLQTLEVPLSHLVSTRGFARFSIQLLSELPRLQRVYNGQLEHYRQAHRIRSHAHPVPALAEVDGWLEAPWWVYRHNAPHRQPLWVRLLDDQLILGDRAGWQATIEGRLDCDSASSQWLDLLADGVCLRPRALLTTMYLRIMVSDLFIHGIGGGKYDQLTDAIVREFFAIEPTPMAVATATLHLPLGSQWPNANAEALAQLQTQQEQQRDRLWHLKYHADQLVEHQSSEQQQLTLRKQELLANIPPRGEKYAWHREMTKINRRLSELSLDEAEQTRQQIDKTTVLQRQQRLLQSRETSFCLYPLDMIEPRLKAMARGEASDLPT